MAPIVGIPKEIKDMEGRVSMQPDAQALLSWYIMATRFYVQSGAGEGSGFSDEEYHRGGSEFRRRT